jgi:riboflavin synthase
MTRAFDPVDAEGITIHGSSRVITMFTGIIQSTGAIASVTPLGDNSGLRVRIDAMGLGCDDIAIGDSVAVSGVCLTVVTKSANDQLDFDVSTETLRCTSGLDVCDKHVNLEKALRFGDRLGGHLVSGHVDGMGTVIRFEPEGESHRLEVETPKELARFVAVKGSVTIDGVSLTVNEVDDTTFAVNLIPHTLAVTTLGQLRVSQRVNLEVDLIARYLDRLLEARSS